MLELNHIKMNYGQRIIYDCANFVAHKNELTIIMGKSGSGKSTLHKIITMSLDTQGEYFIDTKDMNKLSNKEKKQFIKEHMGIVNQNPIFISDLTINDHINLCQSLLNGYQVDEYVQFLQLEEVLNKYPLQLSSGEKMRVAILLAMIHQPEILVFDEPTASLDSYHTHIVVEMIKKYAQSGHYVIVFTHDKILKDVADSLYIIENNKLTSVTREKGNYKNSISLLKANKKAYLYFLFRMYKHQFFFKSMTLLLISLTIAIGCFSIFHGNSTIQYYQNQLNKTEKTGIIYKENIDSLGKLYNEEYGFSELEVKGIKEVKGVKNIWPYIMTRNHEVIQNDLKSVNIKIYQKGQLMHDLDYKNNTYTVATYKNDYKYESNLIKKINSNEGVYVSAYLLYDLFNPDVERYNKKDIENSVQKYDENTEIEFPIIVPIYNLQYKNQKGNQLLGKTMTIKTKIKGIYYQDIPFQFSKGTTTDVSIFYPLDIALKFIQKNKASANELLQDQVKYQNDEGYLTPFYPLYYQFNVDRGISFRTVKENIEAKGYKVLSDYNDAENNLDIIHQLNSGLQMIAVFICLITLFISFGIKCTKKEEYDDYLNFFMEKGFSYQETRKKLIQKFMLESIFCTGVSIILFILMVILGNCLYYNSKTHIQIEFIIITVVFSLSIEVLLPLLVLGRRNKL